MEKLICNCGGEGLCTVCWGTDEVLYDSLVVSRSQHLTKAQIESAIEKGRLAAERVKKAWGFPAPSRMFFRS